MRPRSSPVRTWQSLGGRDVSGSRVGAMQPSSDAGAVLSHRAHGEVPEASTAPGLLSLEARVSRGAPEPWDICHPAALLAGPCHQPCTEIGLCRVQHCRARGALSLPRTFLASLCSLLAFPLLSPHPHLLPRGSLSVHLEPLFLAAAPQGGPWGSPSFPLALGSGGILHLAAMKEQSCLLGASSPREPFRSPFHPWKHAMPQVPSQANAPATSTCVAIEDFRPAAWSLSLLSTRLKHCRIGFVGNESSNRAQRCVH